MKWPTAIVDNFFTDPHSIVKLSNTFKYTTDPEHEWPGTRTPALHKINHNFFEWSTKKIMCVLYPMNVDKLSWSATQYFQRVPYNIYGEEGWIHHDAPHEFTAIIYLSEHPNSGTCLYEGKNFNLNATHAEEKRKFFKELKNRKSMEKARDKANSNFNKIVELYSNFNRLVLFDSYNWHASRNIGNHKTDRLTLVTFFKNIKGNELLAPIPQMRRI
jgi:hypothetical protein